MNELLVTFATIAAITICTAAMIIVHDATSRYEELLNEYNALVLENEGLKEQLIGGTE